MTKVSFMSKLYKNNLYNTKKYTIDLISHIIIGENKMTKYNTDKKINWGIHLIFKKFMTLFGIKFLQQEK